jgi:hypothetical protein
MLVFELDPELRVTGFDRESLASPRLVRRATLKESGGGR